MIYTNKNLRCNLLVKVNQITLFFAFYLFDIIILIYKISIKIMSFYKLQDQISLTDHSGEAPVNILILKNIKTLEMDIVLNLADCLYFIKWSTRVRYRLHNFRVMDHNIYKIDMFLWRYKYKFTTADYKGPK